MGLSFLGGREVSASERLLGGGRRRREWNGDKRMWPETKVSATMRVRHWCCLFGTIAAISYSNSTAAFNDNNARDCATAIYGSVEAGATVSNICGIPPENSAAIIAEFNGERQTLKSDAEAWQSLALARKEEIDQLQRTLDLTNGQIRAAFEGLGEKNIPTEQLATKLLEFAKRLREVSSLAAIEPGDTAKIVELKKQAQEFVNAGLIEQADGILEQVESQQRDIERATVANLAKTIATRGTIAWLKIRLRRGGKSLR